MWTAGVPGLWGKVHYVTDDIYYVNADESGHSDTIIDLHTGQYYACEMPLVANPWSTYVAHSGAIWVTVTVGPELYKFGSPLGKSNEFYIPRNGRIGSVGIAILHRDLYGVIARFGWTIARLNIR